jgi:hypothetical protein
LCIETSKELRTRLAEAVYEEHADQSLTKQLVTCNMDTAYPPIRNRYYFAFVFFLNNYDKIFLITAREISASILINNAGSKYYRNKI